MMDKLVAEGRLLWLLEEVAEQQRPCRFCGRMLYFVRMRSNKLAPLTSEAVNHFQDCGGLSRKTDPPQSKLFDTTPDPL